MALDKKNITLIALTASCIVLLFTLPPIPQDPSYHQFADQRKILSIQNFYNVISNLPFLIIGITGLYTFFKSHSQISYSSIPNIIVFIGVIGIGLGSAYYHYSPSNATLVWDRIPMSVTFMAYFSIIISQYVNKRLGVVLLFPLLIIGIASVLSWYSGELHGNGDLRLYALVQFYPMLAIPLIIFLYPTPASAKIQITGIILLYGIAKLFEAHDAFIFNIGKLISGHSLKHIFAAGASWIIWCMTGKYAAENKIAS